MRTDCQLQDDQLHLRVRRRIVEGRLPLMESQRILAGYGVGRWCAACDHEITAAQMEYEVETPSGPLSFHIGCHVAWQLECMRVQRLAVRALSRRA